MNAIIFTIALAIACLPQAPSADTLNNSPISQTVVSPSDSKSWGGSASCTMVCSDKSCKSITVSCSGEASKSNARKTLTQKIQAEVRAQSGRISGRIKYQLRVEFAPLSTRELREARAETASSENAAAAFRYHVDKSRSVWKVRFAQFSTVRIHTSPKWAPHLIKSFRAKKDILLVKPGQWIEGKINGRWSLLTDADHR